MVHHLNLNIPLCEKRMIWPLSSPDLNQTENLNSVWDAVVAPNPQQSKKLSDSMAGMPITVIEKTGAIFFRLFFQISKKKFGHFFFF